MFKRKSCSIEKQQLIQEIRQCQAELHYVRTALGRIESRQLAKETDQDFSTYEFRTFSQWGEDGLIQYLIRNIPLPNKIFVEFGVQDYKESNTRFLLINNNWSGLIMDSSAAYVESIKQDDLYWQHNLKAIQAFVTKDNINQLLLENGIQREIGLLSIDIDGNDYWIWQSISVINPAIVVVEYNSRFGPKRSVTIPYSSDFSRCQAHHSMIYYGASLQALCSLAQQKGYAFVGCNSNGNNAFFVRKDLKPESIPELTSETGFVAGKFRESRNEQGELLFLSPQEEEHILESLSFVEVN